MYYTWCIILHRNFTYYVLPLGGTVPVLKKLSRINKSQKAVLDKYFVVSFYPSKSKIKHLALQTGMDEERVRAWFRQQRWRRGVHKGD